MAKKASAAKTAEKAPEAKQTKATETQTAKNIILGKKELAAKFAEKTGLTKAQAESQISVLFDTVKEAFAAGEEIRIHGFGTFAIADQAARTVRNPRTGEATECAAKKVLRFKPTPGLKALVNGESE